MASRAPRGTRFGRVFPAVVLAALPPACAAVMVLAVQGRLYACAMVLALAGLWAAVHLAWIAARPPERPAPAPPAARDDASAAAELRLARSLLDQTPAPLIIASSDGVLTAGNRAARRLFGFEDRLIDPPPDLRAALGLGEGGRRLTVRLDTVDGPHVYAVSIAEIVSGRGPLRLAILIDIEPEIRVAEAAALRELMQVLSHELMNALTPVASLAATARDLLGEADPPQVHALDAVATLARRTEGLTRFVEAYRTLARLPEPALAPVSLCALLDETAQLFEVRWGARGARLDLVKPSPDAVREMDLDLMVHALANILSNGAEAALANGPGPAVVSLTAEVSQGAIRLMVEDNGPGVPAADRVAIFRPFFTTKAQGSGVGLSFARQVALSHGGSLSLLPSEPGRGARFVLAL
jgi:two-component system, NtrC family, nitrogen regulation sensor histidine kinase NtrY